MTATTMSDIETSADVLSTTLRGMFDQMHGWLEGTLGDVSAEQAHWHAGGRVVPAGAHYAHHVMGAEDLLLNTLIRGATPLALEAWQGWTGVSEAMPMGPWDEWARQVIIDVPAL